MVVVVGGQLLKVQFPRTVRNTVPWITVWRFIFLPSLNISVGAETDGYLNRQPKSQQARPGQGWGGGQRSYWFTPRTRDTAGTHWKPSSL